MHQPESIHPESVRYFHTPSMLAREIFFYPLCIGSQVCAPGYRIDRTRYDSFLVMYIREGSGWLTGADGLLPFRQGDFVLVDCYRPHSYGTDTGYSMYWMHFDGVLARRYFELCCKNGPVLSLSYPQEGEYQLRCIFESFHRKKEIGEAETSCRIDRLLTGLILGISGPNQQAPGTGVIDRSIRYIAEHLDRELPLREMADQAALSPYHFLRIFKKEVGLTPHAYLIRARVEKAKYLIKSTGMPLKQISEECGFSDSSNFSTIFKKSTGMTPLSYRRM